MPIFEYKCKECNTTYDILHKGTEKKEDICCPECKSKKHVKLISTFSSMNSSGSSFEGGCESGNCGMPSYGGGCPGGMCGLN